MLAKNTKRFTCSGNSRDRKLLTMYPPLLNTLSDLTLVAGIDKYFLASFAITGKRDEFDFHHSKGFESVSMHG